MARKKYKQKYKSKREDFRKGGRVSLRHGGNHIKGAENQEPTKMKFGNPNPESTKPAKAAKSNKPVRDLSDPTGQTFLDPKDVPNMKVGNQEPRNNTPAPPVENRAEPSIPTGPVQIGGKGGKPLPQFDASKKQPPMSVGDVGGSGNVDLDEQFGAVGGETTQEPATPTPTTQPASPEIMRETTPPNGTYTTTNEQGEVVNLLNMLDWEEEYKKSNPRPTAGGLGGLVKKQKWDKEFEIAQQTHQADLDVANFTPAVQTSAAQQAQFEKDRRERIRETGLQIEAASTGQVPEGAVIPDAVQVGIDPETGKPIREQATTTMADSTKVGYQRDAEGNLILDEQGDPIQIQAAQVAPEAVTTGQVKTAPTPEGFEAADITQDELDIVATDADVIAAQGTVQEDKLAKAAEVDRVAPIEGADVDIPKGALAERVVGKISDGAKETAVMNVGSSLSRITRAKKQLSKAGLSDEDIKTIGNDPEALEDRLADFSEEQRGIIEGLPEEALVSTQINGLLEGMENGEIPVWARPAVAQVEQMLARRGLSASTVGRDSLFNAIIQSAMPIAQSNAQAIQSSVAQQRDIEARESEANAARGQQTALDKAGKVFQMDMAQFSSDQQIALSNSKFMQTVGLTEASNDQQATLQSAVLMSQANLAEADFYQKAQIQNAQAFLSMDMANLNNNQQANVLKAQQNQQRLLSNQSAQNAAAQFNAASENQTNQFMSNLNAQMNQYNASQMNAMEQFNATQSNAAEARRAGREADIEKFNAQLITQVDQFNSQQDFARNSWNAQNSATVEASNVQWRRQANTLNTAAQNQINMQNAQNAFGLSSQAMSFLWQELRDQADFDFRGFENEENRKAQIIATAMANEGAAGEKYDDYLTNLLSSLSSSYKAGLGTYTTTSSRSGVKQF
jgi:CRISPR/Cas system CSM-associated protein Csm2 small subunit